MEHGRSVRHPAKEWAVLRMGVPGHPAGWRRKGTFDLRWTATPQSRAGEEGPSTQSHVSGPDPEASQVGLCGPAWVFLADPIRSRPSPLGGGPLPPP